MRQINLDQPSPEQVVIFENILAIKEGSRKVPFGVDAKAGSGKTSTVAASAHAFPDNSAAMAFNKEAAEQLKQKLGMYAPASTFHSAGFSVLKERLGKVQTNIYKIADICKDQLKYGRMYAPYRDVIEHMMTFGIGIEDASEMLNPAVISDAIGYADVAVPDGLTRPTFIKRISLVADAMMSDLKTISFSEMLWLPLRLQNEYKWNLTNYNWLFIDEAQDMSMVRWQLAKALAKNHIPIGDPFQSIYGFAGAMNDCFHRIINEKNMDVLPLSYSWRCPKNVIAHAQSIIGPVIHAPEWADDGYYGQQDCQIVLNQIHDKWYADEDSSYAILCRCNRPLFKIALQWLKENKPFRLWNDMGDRLLRLMNELIKDNKTTRKFLTALADWKSEQDEIYADAKGVLRRIREQFDTIKHLVESSYDPADAILNLKLIMQSDRGPILSTIHKTKGLEFDYVYLYRLDLIPAPWVEEDDLEELAQERNLHYVATTRAKKSFIELFGDED